MSFPLNIRAVMMMRHSHISWCFWRGSCSFFSSPTSSALSHPAGPIPHDSPNIYRTGGQVPRNISSFRGVVSVETSDGGGMLPCRSVVADLANSSFKRLFLGRKRHKSLSFFYLHITQNRPKCNIQILWRCSVLYTHLLWQLRAACPEVLALNVSPISR